jgi:hypothetical protein
VIDIHGIFPSPKYGDAHSAYQPPILSFDNDYLHLNLILKIYVDLQTLLITSTSTESKLPLMGAFGLRITTLQLSTLNLSVIVVAILFARYSIKLYFLWQNILVISSYIRE